ncbi:MAG: transposase [Methylobacter sp.]
MFEHEGERGVPPRVSRRLLVDACFYAVRTGCAWRMLPKDFPHLDNIYKTFRGWSAQGRFEAMHDRLMTMWRAYEPRMRTQSCDFGYAKHSQFASRWRVRLRCGQESERP